MRPLLALIVSLAVASAAAAQPRAPMTRPADGKLPHIQVDVKAKQVRVECEAVNAEMPLEFLLCATNTQEHEAVLRSSAKASHIHLALLMLGLQPGEPIKYNKAADKWIAPHGPPLQIRCEWDKAGQTVSVPAYRMMRDVKTKKEMPPTTWVFCGSRITDEGNYAGDITGYLVSIVNFDFTLIDIPAIHSNANETLEWEFNPDTCPKKGTKVWMVIEPAGDKGKGPDKGPTTRAEAAPAAAAAEPVVVSVDAAGGVEVNGKIIEAKDLPDHLALLKTKQQVQVRLVVGAGAEPGTVKKVQMALTAADVPVTEDGRMSDVSVDEARLKALRQQWEKAMQPHRKELNAAAQTHYEVIASLRKEQQRLIDESDRIQRVIDEIQKEWQDIVTPRPTANN